MTARTLVALAVVWPALAGADLAADAAKLDELYAHRDTGEAQGDSDRLVAQTSGPAATDYGILWRATRWKWWVADGATGDRKETLAKQAMELGDRAVKANPNGLEGRYFAGVAIGAYSQAVGVLKALTQGLEGKFNENIDTAVKLDPGFMGCAPLIAKGRYHYELPWPKRDLEKSAELLNQALAKCPASTRAFVYLAQTQLKAGDAKAAKATLGRMPRDDGYDPPETHRSLGMAKQLEAQVDAELK